MMVEIALVYKEDEELKIEKVDAVAMGSYYQIKSVPAFACNVAYDDIVSAEEDGGLLFFEELIEASGHSAIHIAILKAEHSSTIIARLIALGAGVNYLHNNTYLVVDVPTSVDYNALRLFITAESKLGIIDFEESCLSDQHRIQIEC